MIFKYFCLGQREVLKLCELSPTFPPFLSIKEFLHQKFVSFLCSTKLCLALSTKNVLRLGSTFGQLQLSSNFCCPEKYNESELHALQRYFGVWYIYITIVW